MRLALTAIQRVLRVVRARWYLFGAQAVVLHGVPRYTDDIDVTVLLPEPGELLKALPRYGFSTRVEDAGFLASSRVIPTVHQPSGWRVDFVLGGPGLEQHFLESAEVKAIGPLKIPVIRAEHLVVLKVFAGRPKDLEDVRGVLRLNRIDLDEVRELIGMLERELGDSTILPVLEKVLAESRLSTNLPAGMGRRRG